ncbi:dnaJ homolog subfamily C member 2, partial [Plectropomus leopardus]|uniref:dnaJ homolog subfamily C member 2 n=1 Tax=Plectropomus leopardus TaxID=160734 RepID=UPI001C4DB360
NYKKRRTVIWAHESVCGVFQARQAELEAARLAKEKEEEEAKQVAQQAKKEKEIQKKAIKKERQKLRTTCKNWNYFADNEADSVKMMEEVEKLCDRLELTSLQSLNEILASGSKEDSKVAVEKQVQEVNAQLQREKEAEVQMRQAARSAEQASGGGGAGGKGWNEEDLQLLIKAVNLFPAGTNARWEVIANYMNLHSTSGMKRTAKDVINKAKNLQRLDPVQKDEINRKAFEKFKKEHGSVAPTIDNAVPSERFDASGSDSNAASWTTEEQKLLEQALKTYPVSTPERWEKIAAAVPGRSKKDCMKRYKELVEMVKAKKAAQEQVANKSKK